ncbi:hypothetical protein HGRIS_004935 [Hohenbuehelia grisea]|uniref:Protein kinase domain-containing protein n=1 Tax=Hohenbuehelia grisea TaxID=104357 RepID=A0ABR3JE24_9AGAR
MPSRMGLNSAIVRCGWAKVKRGGKLISSRRGWNQKWLILGSTLKIYDKGTSNYAEIDCATVSKLERVDVQGAPFCCHIIAASSIRFLISFASDAELYDWLHDLYSASPLSYPVSLNAPGIPPQTQPQPAFLDVPNEWDSPVSDHPPKASSSHDWPLPSPVFASESYSRSSSPGFSPSAVTFPQILSHTEWPRYQPSSIDIAIEPASSESSPETVHPPHSEEYGEWFDDILEAYEHDDLLEHERGSPPLARKTAVKRRAGDRHHRSHTVPTVGSSWTVHKQKLYQNLLSLLVEVTSSEGLAVDHSLMNTVRELFKSMAMLDSISHFFENELPPSSRTRFRQIHENDETELVNLLRTISTSSSGFQAVLGLRGERAQQFLDMAQEILDYPSLRQSEDRRFSTRVLKLMIRLSEICHRLPSSLFVKDSVPLDTEPVSCGNFSDIYRAIYQGEVVALKRLRIFQPDRDSSQFKFRQKFCREALFWRHVRHPNVMPFIGIDSETFGSSLCLVSPWMQNGTVLRYLKGNGRDGVDKLLLEVAQGLSYLHSLDVVHGDLRGANILVNDSGHACIADFGLTVFTDTLSYTGSSSSYSGSARWMAPELLYPACLGLEKFRRTKASDVYSFACVCVELYTGRPPFYEVHHDATIAMMVVDQKRPPRPWNDTRTDAIPMPDALWALVRSCWSHNFAHRPASRDVVHDLSLISSQGI